MAEIPDIRTFGPLVAGLLGLGTNLKVDGAKIGTLLSGAIAGQGNMGDIEAIGRQIEDNVSRHYGRKINQDLFSMLARQKQSLAYKINKDLLGLEGTTAKTQALSNFSIGNLLATAWFASPGIDYYGTATKLSGLVPKQLNAKNPQAAQNASQFSRQAFHFIMSKGDRWKYDLDNTEMADMFTYAYNNGSFSLLTHNKGALDANAINQQLNSLSRLGEVAKQISPNRSLSEGITFLNQSLGSDFLLSPKRVNQSAESLYRLTRLSALTGEDPAGMIADIGKAMQGQPGMSAARMLATAENFLKVKATAKLKYGLPLDNDSSAKVLGFLHEAQDSDIGKVAGAAYSRFVRQYGKEKAGTMMSSLLSDPKAMTSTSDLLKAVNQRVGYGSIPFDMREVQLAEGDDTAVGFRHSSGFASHFLKNKANDLRNNMTKGIEGALGGTLGREDAFKIKQLMGSNYDIDTVMKQAVGMKYGTNWEKGHNRDARAYYNKLRQSIGNLGAESKVANIFANPDFITSFRDTNLDIMDPKQKYNLEGVGRSGKMGIQQLFMDKNRDVDFKDIITKGIFGDTLDNEIVINPDGSGIRKSI